MPGWVENIRSQKTFGQILLYSREFPEDPQCHHCQLPPLDQLWQGKLEVARTPPQLNISASAIANIIAVLLDLHPKVAAPDVKMRLSLEEAPAHRHEIGDVVDPVGPNVVELAAIEKQKPVNEIIKRERQTLGDEWRQNDALVRSEHQRDLCLWRHSLTNHHLPWEDAIIYKLVQLVLRHG